MNVESGRSVSELRAAFVAVTTLFFAWGFITAMIDPVIPTVKMIFQLTYQQSTLVQSAFFMAYGVMSLPGAALVGRFGYGRSILVALGVMIAGCLLVPVAASVQRYELVLVALFIIGCGITVLQLAANPLAAVLGSAERSHFRLTLSQAFNSLGTVLAPYLGAQLLLRGGMFEAGAGQGAADAAAGRAATLHSVGLSFELIAGMIVLLAVFIWRFSGRLSRAAPPAAPAHDSVLMALRSRWALLGAGAIFLYVGAEVSIGSFMINFLHEPRILDVDFATAGNLLSLYWLGAMVGRFLGSALLTRVAAARLLAAAAAIAVILCVTVSQGAGVAAASCAIAVGLMNSIMFPTIFTLSLERSSASAAATSGLLCLAIIGGAVLPRIMGILADHFPLQTAFLLPASAYLAITLFALGAARAPVREIGRGAVAGGH